MSHLYPFLLRWVSQSNKQMWPWYVWYKSGIKNPKNFIGSRCAYTSDVLNDNCVQCSDASTQSFDAFSDACYDPSDANYDSSQWQKQIISVIGPYFLEEFGLLHWKKAKIRRIVIGPFYMIILFRWQRKHFSRLSRESKPAFLVSQLVFFHVDSFSHICSI